MSDLLKPKRSTESSRKLLADFIDGADIDLSQPEIRQALMIECDCLQRRIAMARTVMGTVETAKYKTMVRNADIGVRE